MTFISVIRVVKKSKLILIILPVLVHVAVNCNTVVNLMTKNLLMKKDTTNNRTGNTKVVTGTIIDKR